jgi:CIC family chloride channel protein
MGTAFAGIVRTPLTSVFMIFEVTRDYTIIVPLMISNLIAFFISQRLQPQAIYEALARQDGLHLPTDEHRAKRAKLRVTAAMRPATGETLSPRASVADALAQRAQSPLEAWPVVEGVELQGMVERRELEQALAAGRGDQPLAALLRTRPSPHRADAAALPHVHPDHGLTLALERMGALRHTVLPVVSRSNIRHLLGVVTLEDVLEAYGVERSHARAADHD